MQGINKLLVLAILAVALTAQTAGATEDSIEYTLYLSSTLDTGVTTVASGTSTPVVAGGGYARADGGTIIHDLDKLGLATCVFQIQDIAASQGRVAAGGYSGTTFTVRYWESAVSGTTYSAKAQRVNIVSDLALSGNTLYQVPFYPVGMGDLGFEVVSGTPLDRAVFVIKLMK